MNWRNFVQRIPLGRRSARRAIVSVVAALVALSTAPTANAWTLSGHEAAAQIAWGRLNPKTRVKLEAILEQHPERDNDLLRRMQTDDDRDVSLFINAAAWPETVRSANDKLHATENHPDWHSVQYPLDFGVNGPPPDEGWDGETNPENSLQAWQKNVKSLHRQDDAAGPAGDRALLDRVSGR